MKIRRIHKALFILSLFTLIMLANLTVYAETIQTEEWYQEKGTWKIKDSSGKWIKDTWYCDSKGSWFLMDKQGYMKKGIINNNGQYYLLDMATNEDEKINISKIKDFDKKESQTTSNKESSSLKENKNSKVRKESKSKEKSIIYIVDTLNSRIQIHNSGCDLLGKEEGRSTLENWNGTLDEAVASGYTKCPACILNIHSSSTKNNTIEGFYLDVEKSTTYSNNSITYNDNSNQENYIAVWN